MLTVKNMSTKYGKERVLDNISFTSEPGKMTIVIGPNGVGKSSVFKSISGLIPLAGQVYLDAKPLTKANRLETEFKISYLSQDSNCHADLTVFEVVLLGMMDRLSLKVSDEQIHKVIGILREMQLTDIANKNISELSGGQRQMVFIAQTLVSEPRVLLLDEPISSLDLYRQYELLNYIQKITEKRNIITLIILHHLDIAAQYADHIIIFKDKSIYREGPPKNTITEQMLRDVYQIRGKVIQEENGCLHVITLGALQ